MEQYNWPTGFGGQPGPPMGAVMMNAGRVPMFAGDPGHRYTGPFNMQLPGGMGMMAQMAMPQLMNNFMGNSFAGQFFPEQNLYDQIAAQQNFIANQQAMQLASQRDAAAMQSMLGGLQQMVTGQPLTQMDQARNFRISQGISQAMPILTQVLGPDLIDRLHGSRGSATVFAQQFHQAMRTGVDPITGRIGYSGESAGMVTQEVFDQLFGPNANMAQMRGMSAGQAGIVLNELQARGMLGQPIGSMPIQSQRSLIPQTLGESTINRLATQLPDIQRVLNEGGTPTERMLEAARQQVRQSHQQLTDPTLQLTRQDILNMPGAEGIIQTADAERIQTRLKEMAGSVKAMRDIFGDMGQPNAPMRQIINGLEQLTQGGLATLPAAQVEAMVRQTHALAKQTGVGMQGVFAMASQHNKLALELGLDPTFSLRATNQSIAFGAGAGDTLALGTPTWGAQTKEQLTINDAELRMHAAASPLANQLSAIARMADTGMIAPQDGTELAAMVDAVRAGQLNYTFGGRQRSLVMHRTRLMNILNQDSNITSGEANAIISDTFGNQEYMQRYNLDATARRSQRGETMQRMFNPLLASRFSSVLGSENIDELMQAQGIVADTGEFNTMMDQIAAGVSEDYMSMPGETIRDPAARRGALGTAFRTRLRQAVARRMPNAAPGQVDQMVDTLVNQMGGDQAMTSMGETIHATINAAARKHPAMRSGVGAHDVMSQEAMNAADARRRQANATAAVQASLAGMGTSGPIQRIADMLQTADANTPIHEVMRQVLGGVNMDQLEQNDPSGIVAETLGLVRATQALDPNDPDQYRQIMQNAGIIRGLVEGGATAQEEIRKMESSRKTISLADANDAQKSAAITRLQNEETKAARIRDARNTTNAQYLQDIDANLAAAANSGLSADERRTAARNARSRMKAMIPEEGIALGGNRYLTRRGIVTRDASGRESNLRPLTEGQVAAEAQRALRGHHSSNLQDAAREDAARQGRSQQEMLREAESQGLIRGDLGYGSERILQRLYGAVNGDDSAGGQVSGLGYMLNASVKPEQVAATLNSGKLAAEAIASGEITDENSSAIKTFVMGSAERARQLIQDTRSMEQLGRGGLKLVQSAIDGSRELQAMAAEHGVSVDALLQGQGVPRSVRDKARQVMQGMQGSWTEIEKRNKSQMLPGTGDAANAARKKMTTSEKDELLQYQQFTRQYDTAEKQASEVTDRLISLASPEQQARLNVDINKQSIEKELLEGDRGRWAMRAINSRDALLQMGIKKGVFGDKTRVNQLTAEEKLSVAERLRNLNLSEEEQADVQRMSETAAPFMDFGLQNMSPDKITQDLKRRLQQYSGTPPEKTGEDAENKELKVTVRGTVTPRADGDWDLNMDGAGLLDSVGRALGFS